jgi:SAM-dependent methyltransferase
VSEEILRQIDVQKTDVLVDIGCGDGTLLKLAAGSLGNGIGIVPTAEESERVRSELRNAAPKIKVRQGLVQKTDLEEAVADKIVCNGVILLLAENEVDEALREIVRVSKPNALVFIGEVPTKNEFGDRTYGDSVIGWLWWVLTREGVSAFLRRWRQVLRAIFAGELFIIFPKTHFHEPADRFIERAKRAGLVLEASFPHSQANRGDEVQTSEARLDYLFRAPAKRDRGEGRLVGGSSRH